MIRSPVTRGSRPATRHSRWANQRSPIGKRRAGFTPPALYTTPTDLAKWDLALVGGKVLKPASYRLMTAQRELADGRLRSYGCGIGVVHRQGETILRHSGAVSGFLAFNAVFPRTKSAVVLMSNAEHQDASDIDNVLLALMLKAQEPPSPDVPKIAGLSAKDAAIDLLRQLQAGEVKRDILGEEYSVFLTPEHVRGAKERLGKLGEPEKVTVDPPSERGGMEVVLVHFAFKKAKVKTLMYRTPDGKVQEFLIYKE